MRRIFVGLLVLVLVLCLVAVSTASAATAPITGPSGICHQKSTAPDHGIASLDRDGDLFEVNLTARRLPANQTFNILVAEQYLDGTNVIGCSWLHSVGAMTNRGGVTHFRGTLPAFGSGIYPYAVLILPDEFFGFGAFGTGPIYLS